MTICTGRPHEFENRNNQLYLKCLRNEHIRFDYLSLYLTITDLILVIRIYLMSVDVCDESRM